LRRTIDPGLTVSSYATRSLSRVAALSFVHFWPPRAIAVVCTVTNKVSAVEAWTGRGMGACEGVGGSCMWEPSPEP